MAKNFFISVLVGMTLNMSSAVAADVELQSLVDGFIQRAPAQWNFQQGQWKYVDIISCFTSGQTCFGNNPTSPYGYPSFDSTDTVGTFNLDVSEAIVIFLRTPPKMRYFGFTQYLFQRGQSPKPVFASLSDTLNNLHFKVISTDAASVFDELSVIVWTGDVRTFNKVQQQLALQGIDTDKINFIPLPITFPLNMGYSADADKFAMLMRTAMPDVQQNWSLYMQDNPVQVFKINPNSQEEVIPAPIVGYAAEISGNSESTELKTALDSLVEDLRSKYRRTFSFSENNVSYTNKVGWDCIAGNAQCNGDNHDALYSVDSPTIRVKNLKDVMFVVGVNHQKTNKALYLNHSVYDPSKLAGIVSVADTLMTSTSAYYHGGVTVRDKDKMKMYSKLYAYAISYNCTGLEYCLQIPAPSTQNPVGLEPGSPFFVIGRSYVEPTTTVRPSSLEVIKHRTFTASLK